MKTLVAYYSHSGNNRVLASRLASGLGAGIEEIKPRCGAFFFQLLFTAFGHGPGIKRPRGDTDDAETIVLVAPLWMGSVAWPARAFIRSRGASARAVHLVTCCGSDDAGKDGQFGYETAFAKFRVILGSRAGTFAAMPSVLVLPEDKRTNDEAAMSARLSDASFTGEIADRLSGIISRIRA